MATNLKPYGEYKDTEYDWLGDVPEHWKRVTVRSITKLSNERNGTRDDLELLSVYREYGVIRKSSRDDNHNVESQDLSNYKFVDNGYIVLNKMKMWQGSLGVSKYRGIVSPAYIVCKLVGELNFKYIHYLLRSPQFKTQYNRISYGVRIGQWDMRYDDFKNIKLYLPPLDEQEQIVKYLDSQLAKINKFIKSKKKLISVLKEQKQAVINEAVTKGINPNVKMKPSGVDWLSDIPEHWEVRRLKNLGKATIGLTYSPADLVDETGTLVLRSSNIKDGRIELSNNVFVKKDIPEKLRTKINDILICSRNGSRELVGKSAMIDKTSAGLSFGAFTTVFRSEYNTFLFQVFNSMLFKYQCGTFFTSTINQLTINNLNRLVVPFPPVKEQEEIVSHLINETKVFDKGIETIEREIYLITEYRTRLISDVVTGKVDVRNAIVDEIIEVDIEIDEKELNDNDEVVDSEECEV
ncbi:restriction endonuclease subunit S [Metabacillus sp. B2-18]|uniref:restriction endonuclease subunit S n=1 Tax=Metabacillus sp. B2-18 TaxID=2897333 RepID=UPI001E51F3FB|nr:restriction endonuclease subunit S [Metabacillus sp. B2-18]UGB29950.1 restriction endonuclease subunit S [Metabacillus sp. B2-18]